MQRIIISSFIVDKHYNFASQTNIHKNIIYLDREISQCIAYVWLCSFKMQVIGKKSFLVFRERTRRQSEEDQI